MDLASRLKAARGALGLKQAELATKSGCSPSTYQKYEQGSSVPGGEAIAGLVRLGINANWLLTGDGPMLLADLAPPPLKINIEALGIMLQAVEMAHPNAPPARKAALAAEFYALSVAQGHVSADDIHPTAVKDAA